MCLLRIAEVVLPIDMEESSIIGNLNKGDKLSYAISLDKYSANDTIGY